MSRSLQGTDNFNNVKCEALYIADHKYVKISSFPVLDIKLWLEEDSDLDTGNLLYSFKLIQSKVQNL